MGKDPSTFVPVKYGSAEEQAANPVLNMMTAASFAMFALIIYRTIHGKGGNNTKKPKSGSDGGFG